MKLFFLFSIFVARTAVRAQMSGAYTLREVFGRLHPRYLFEESRGQLVDAFWGAADLGVPDINVFTGRPHAHHPVTGQPFDPDVHKRHPWDTKRAPPLRSPFDPRFWSGGVAGYAEVNEPTEKQDVPRSAHAEAAHSHFTAALHQLNMLDQQRVFHARVGYDPANRQLDVESLESVEQQRDRAVALGFNRYLLHRHRGAVVQKGATAGDSTFSNVAGLKQSRRTLRAGTFNLLARTIPPWQSELELLRNWLSILFLVYVLFFQVRGCQLILRGGAPWWSVVAPPVPGLDENAAMAASMRVFAILFVKEIYPVTYYAFWLLTLCLSLLLGLVIVVLAVVLLGPLVWAFETLLGGDQQRRVHNLASVKALGRAILRDPLRVFLHKSLAQQVHVWSLMALNLSSIYRIKELYIASTYRRKVKPSIRDGDNKLTTVSNILFNLVLLSVGPTNSHNIIVGVMVSLTVLFYQMVCEKQRNMDLAESLRDVNENRLSKFELALLLCKLIDDVTLEEVQYNFVEHFYSDWRAQDTNRLDHVCTEEADDADPLHLNDNPESSLVDDVSPRGASPRGISLGAPRPTSVLFGDETSASEEMLYLYHP